MVQALETQPDRIEFATYRTIGQFQEYLLLKQSSDSVEQYIKLAPNQWLFVEHSGAEATIALHSVAVELSMADRTTRWNLPLKMKRLTMWQGRKIEKEMR